MSDRPTTRKITPLDLPEAALLRAVHLLSLSVGEGVPLSDYADAVVLLFSELATYGWLISPPVSHAHARDSETNAECIAEREFETLREAHPRAEPYKTTLP